MSSNERSENFLFLSIITAIVNLNGYFHRYKLNSLLCIQIQYKGIYFIYRIFKIFLQVCSPIVANCVKPVALFGPNTIWVRTVQSPLFLKGALSNIRRES
ncbi:hypothetical protein DBO95_23385 [Yersinia pestis]|nr:hypothetical protein AU253_12935 [Yersinia pestis]PCN67308.1 hypothetical protein A8V49_07080 [Yersinia pestis]PVF11479.1 hypothetical protein DBO95_23385 [Yersinia pestis]